MTATDPTKRQRSNTEAEASILGGIFLRPELLRQLAELEVGDFANARHQAVFAAMRSLEAVGSAVDYTTVADEVVRAGKSPQFSESDDKADHVTMVQAFAAELTMRVASVENVLEYVEIVRRFRVERDLRTALADCVEAIDNPSADDGLSGANAVAWCQARIARVPTKIASRATKIYPAVQARMASLERVAQERLTGHPTLTGAPTSVAKLDGFIGGVQYGIVTIIAARPGMGKTALAMGVADAASAADVGAHVFSMEDSLDRYADRVLARQSRVPAQAFAQATLNRGQMGDINYAMHRLKMRQNWLVDDRAGLTAAEIVRSIRAEAEANKTRVVVVDYVQLVKAMNHRAPRHEQLDEIVTTFATAAKDRYPWAPSGIAYVVLSQLNRAVEGRPDKRPVLSDLKESGALEERCKACVMLYRGAYYGPPVAGIDYKRDESAPDGEEWQRLVELHITKNTNGATGYIAAEWDGPLTMIS